MTHASVAGSPLAVPDDLVRLSVGIEHPDDLIEDLGERPRPVGARLGPKLERPTVGERQHHAP